MRAFFALLALSFSMLLWGQTHITGVVLDEKDIPLPSVIVKVMNAQNRTVSYATTRRDGRFDITLRQSEDSLLLTFQLMAYEKKTIPLADFRANQAVRLLPKDMELKEVNVMAPVVREKGDTISYSVDQLKDATDRSIEDVIRKIPGITVGSSGQIKYNGESINKFYIEGLDMLGGRYAIASRNIQADDVATVSVYKHHQPKRVLNGIERSEKAALNLTLKKDRKVRPIGSATVGAGYAWNPEWLANSYTLLVRPSWQLMATLKANSTGTLSSQETRVLIDEDKATGTYVSNLYPRLSEPPSNMPESRAIDNNSVSATFNTIRAIRKDLTMRWNGGYSFDNSVHSQLRSVQYSRPQELPFTLNEQIENRTNRHVAWLENLYENNDSLFYVSNKLSANVSFLSNGCDILTSSPVSQSISASDYCIKDNFNTIFRAGKHMLNVLSNVTFAHTPRNNLSAVTDSAGCDVVTQQAAGMHFAANATTSYSWMMNNASSLSLTGNLVATYDKIKMDSHSSLWQNCDYGGYTLCAELTPSYKYRNKKVFFDAGLPLRLHSIGFRERIGEDDYSLLTPRIGFTANFRYLLTPRLYTTLSFVADRSIGDIPDLVTTPYMSSYRDTRVMGNGEMNSQWTFNPRGQLIYHNTLSGFNASILASYKLAMSNRVSALDVSESSTDRYTARYENKRHLVIVNGVLRKNFFEKNMTVGLSGDFQNISAMTIRQGRLTSSASRIYTVRGTFRKTLAKDLLVVDATCGYSLYTQELSVGNVPLPNENDIISTASVAVFPVSNLELFMTVSYDCYKQENTPCQGNVLLDCGARYQWKKFTVNLGMKNLTNRKSYSLRRTYDMNVYRYTYHLRPLEILATLSYTF